MSPAARQGPLRFRMRLAKWGGAIEDLLQEE